MKFQYNDGGRSQAGYSGQASDCVTRAIAIASGRSYLDIYNTINLLSKEERKVRGRSTARNGVYKRTADKLLRRLGAKWVSCMGIGTGCQIHLTDGQVPMGRIVVRVSKHFVAIIDGVLNDTSDCSRGGKRCVYGYYKF